MPTGGFFAPGTPGAFPTFRPTLTGFRPPSTELLPTLTNLRQPWREIALSGTIGTEPILITKPVGFPGSVPAGILSRYLLLVNAIKVHKNYTIPIGDILGIEGAEATHPDFITIQPNITAHVTASVVKLIWGWLGFRAFLSMCELQVDRGSGWTVLAYDTTPNYEDTTPFPATPTIWKYRAIYRVGDHQVGLWSLEVSVTVGG